MDESKNEVETMTIQTFQLIWKITKELIVEIFKISLLSYLVFYLIEDFFPGFVSSFFSMNILLGIVVASGVFTVAQEPASAKASASSKLSADRSAGEGRVEQNKIKARDIVFIVILSIIAGGLIYLKTKSLGGLGLAISIISCIIILLMSVLLLIEDDENIS